MWHFKSVLSKTLQNTILSHTGCWLKIYVLSDKSSWVFTTQLKSFVYIRSWSELVSVGDWWSPQIIPTLHNLHICSCQLSLKSHPNPFVKRARYANDIGTITHGPNFLNLTNKIVSVRRMYLNSYNAISFTFLR